MKKLTLLALLLAGCHNQPTTAPTFDPSEWTTDGTHHYRICRPFRQVGPNLFEIELYERFGVSTNEWVYVMWNANPPQFRAIPGF